MKTRAFPNIVIVVIDTLRLDAFKKLEAKRSLSALGNFQILSNAIAPSSWTLPSHASLFTGLYPSKHGAHETKQVKSLDIERIKLRMPTFVSMLNSVGYNTYAISANPYVHPVYGFNEFMDFEEETYFTDLFGSIIEVSDKLKQRLAKYRNMYGGADLVRLPLKVLSDDPDLFFEAVISGTKNLPAQLLKRTKGKLEGWPIEKGGRHIKQVLTRKELKEPYFLFVNLMEAHDPYTSNKKTNFDWATPFLKEKPSPDLVSLWKRLYKKAAGKGYSYAYDIAKLMLDRFGDEQAIILTSDHGQLFGEHGFYGHGTVLYDEAIQVPFAVLLPKKFKHVQQHGYLSLVNVRKFVERLIGNDANAMSALFTNRACAESFGVPAHLSKVKGIDLKKLNKYETKQKRCFG